MWYLSVKPTSWASFDQKSTFRLNLKLAQISRWIINVYVGTIVLKNKTKQLAIFEILGFVSFLFQVFHTESWSHGCSLDARHASRWTVIVHFRGMVHKRAQYDHHARWVTLFDKNVRYLGPVTIIMLWIFVNFCVCRLYPGKIGILLFYCDF